MSKCCLCGGELVWNNETSIPDGRSENTYRCNRCGSEISILEPTDEEKTDEYASYWANKGCKNARDR